MVRPIMTKFGVWLHRDQAVMHISQIMNVVHLYVRPCVLLFRISGTAGKIAVKFSAWLETHQPYVLHKPKVGCICTCALFHIL